MITTKNNLSIYHLSENLSDFLFEYLNENVQVNTHDWSYEQQKIDNPKITFFEQRVAALEGGTNALAVKSFNKAKMSVIKSLLRAGDNIVTYNSHSLYYKDSERLNRAGIEVRLSEDGTLSTFRKLINEKTKLIYLETISPYYLNIPDFQKIVIIARENDIPVLVDNTAGAAGYLTSPLKNGANIVIEKTKHWLPSHKGLIGAVIIDGGNYNWNNGKFPQFLKPEFHYIPVNDNKAEEKNYVFSLIHYIKREGNINYSPYSIPEDPLALIFDLEHIGAVIQNQSDNARQLAEYLKKHNDIKEVGYTGLTDNPGYFKALTYFRHGFGSEISFSLKNALNLTVFISHLQSEKSVLNGHVNVSDHTVRISVPFADIEELIQLFDNAFTASAQKNDASAQSGIKEYTGLNSLASIF